MKQFFPSRRLTFSEISLIPEAVYYLIIARFKVSFLSSKRYLPKSGPSIVLKNDEGEKLKASVISSVINGLSTRTLWPSTCLVKALATHRMLQKRAISHKIHFGVSKNSGKKLEAHAWLSVDDEVIIGGENNEPFIEVSRINCPFVL